MARLGPRLFCKALFQALGVNSTDFTYGVSKVFFKPGKFAAFDQMMQSDPETLKALIKKVEKWLIRARWRQAIHCVWMVIKCKKKLEWRREKLTTIQAYWRGALVRRRLKKLLEANRKVGALKSRSSELIELAEKIPKGKAKDAMKKEVLDYAQILKAIRSEVYQATKLKTGSEVLKKLDSVMKKVNQMNAREKELMTKIAALNKAEQERIRKMEEERKRKEEEERLRKLAEEEQKR